MVGRFGNFKCCTLVVYSSPKAILRLTFGPNVLATDHNKFKSNKSCPHLTGATNPSTFGHLGYYNTHTQTIAPVRLRDGNPRRRTTVSDGLLIRQIRPTNRRTFADWLRSALRPLGLIVRVICVSLSRSLNNCPS